MSHETVRPLSEEDLQILSLETKTVAGHACKVIMLGEQIDVELLRSSIASRLDQALPLRIRLEAVDGQPCWVVDPNLDMGAHVVLVDQSEALDMARFRSAVARIFEQRLDRARPLWRMDLIPRLAGGGSALIWRLHHAVADGETTIRVARAALWDEGLDVDAASGARRESVPVTPGSVPVSRERGPVTRERRSLGQRPLDGVRAATREAPRPWRRSPFDGHIDARRAVAFTSADLPAMRRAAHAVDHATVNDAVLTVVAGGLRRWLESRHGHLGEVRVKVPVSLHGDVAAADSSSEPGNRDSFFCLDLPLAPADPVERLRAVHQSTRVRKAAHDAQELDTLMRALGHIPRLRSFAEHVLASPRSFALNVSNIRGPGQPVHLLGAPVRELYSLAEIRERHALRITVVSLGDSLRFGLTCDPTLVPDIGQLADHIHADVVALLAAV
jgi:WS/DGAT/MGAT family acyltransferase